MQNNIVGGTGGIVLDSQSIHQKTVDYKWIIVGTCFLMVFVALGFCSSNKSMYVAAITEANGILRGLYSFNDSCRYISTAIVNIFFGHLVAKYGTKKLIVCGFISLIISSLLYSVASHVVLFYIGGCFLGAGLSFTTTAMVGCVINRWFKKNKGTVMGIILSANGLGGALAAQIVYPMIYEEGNAFGYRNAYRLVAVILLVTMLIVALFMKENPKGEEKTETTVSKKKPRGESWSGVEFKDAKRQAFFWGTAICIFFTGFMLQGINGVAATHMKDVKLDAEYIVTVLSVHSIALTVSKFLTGFIYDKLGLRFTVTLCSISAIIAMFSLFVLSNSAHGKVAAMCYGVISTLALPLETIMLPIFAGDLFGQKSFDKVLGIFVSVNTAGFALGSPVMNIIYDKLGSYVVAFAVCGVLMAVVTVVMQFVIHSAHLFRKRVEAGVLSEDV